MLAFNKDSVNTLNSTIKSIPPSLIKERELLGLSDLFPISLKKLAPFRCNQNPRFCIEITFVVIVPYTSIAHKISRSVLYGNSL